MIKTKFRIPLWIRRLLCKVFGVHIKYEYKGVSGGFSCICGEARW